MRKFKVTVAYRSGELERALNELREANHTILFITAASGGEYTIVSLPEKAA